MASRALIIAIEDYSNAAGMAKKLDGTVKAGLDFKTWLEKKWKAEGVSETQVLLCTEPKHPVNHPNHRAAARKDILLALSQLKAEGAGQTDELFVFFSGHGFSFTEGEEPADVIITSDYLDPQVSGDCCLKLDQIVDWLRAHMGPGRHVYFINACRNQLDASQVVPGSLLPRDKNRTEEASTFVLPAAATGAVTAVNGPFSTALLEALDGRGKAKTWGDDADRMFVTFTSLVQFVQGAIKSPLDPRISGATDAVLATIVPVPLCVCSVKVNNGNPADQLILTIKRGRGAPDVHNRQGAEAQFPLEPDKYSVSLRIPGADVTPLSQAIDLFENQTLSFDKVPVSGLESAGPFEAAPPAVPAILEAVQGAQANVDIVVPRNAEVVLRRASAIGGVENALTREGDEERIFAASTTERLPQGNYTTMLRDATTRTVLRTERVELSGGEQATIGETPERLNVAQNSVAAALPRLGDGTPLFSESLGDAVIEDDPNVWLALVGGGKILCDGSRFMKLGTLPLTSFHDDPATNSGVWVVGGFSDPSLSLEAGLRTGEFTQWTAAHPSPLAGVAETKLSPVPGPCLVSVRVIGSNVRERVLTLASFTFPGHITLVTLSAEARGRMILNQYILPLGTRIGSLPPDRQAMLAPRHLLKDVLFTARALRVLRQRLNPWQTLSDPQLEELISGAWVDPIATPLAAWAMLRLGRTREIDTMAGGLARDFPDHPDLPAMRQAAGFDGPEGQSPSLFLDGMRFLPGNSWPLPEGHCDERGPWTVWRLGSRT